MSRYDAICCHRNSPRSDDGAKKASKSVWTKIEAINHSY